MRIGIDARTLSYRYSGIPIYVHDTIFCWNSYKTEDEFFLYSNRPFSLDFELSSNWHVCIDEHKLGTIWTQTRIPALIKRDRIDVFWEPMNFLPKKVDGVKYLVTIHDLAVYLYPQFGRFSDAILERLLLKRSCNRANKIIAISESTKADIVKHLRVNEGKISVIYNGGSPYIEKEPSYSIKQRDKILHERGLDPGAFLLFVGTIEPRKNVDTIVNAYELLREHKEYDGKLVIAGKPGWKCSDTLKHINKSKYSKDIVLTGYISEIEKECLYRNASCLVFPSLYEGFGFPIIEAMSVGLPVIAGDIASMPEVGGDAATYIERRNIKNAMVVANAIKERLSESADKKKSLRVNMLRVAAGFKREDSAREIYRLITTS